MRRRRPGRELVDLAVLVGIGPFPNPGAELNAEHVAMRVTAITDLSILLVLHVAAGCFDRR